ncbi:hypothetical protein J6590_083156 [Homalodisca vitripennis]|nr:hypothetical protein J6590_083156 [Homalodisca vitripennis]
MWNLPPSTRTPPVQRSLEATQVELQSTQLHLFRGIRQWTVQGNSASSFLWSFLSEIYFGRKVCNLPLATRPLVSFLLRRNLAVGPPSRSGPAKNNMVKSLHQVPDQQTSLPGWTKGMCGQPTD